MAYDINQIKRVYDELTQKIKNDLNEQFINGRLKGSDYANVYASLMSTCVQLAFESPLKEAQTGLIKEQQLTEQEKRKQIEYELTEILPAKKNEIEENIKTLQRQRQGFDDNFKFKMFDSQMNAWGIMYSSGMLEDKPSIVSNDEVSSLYSDMEYVLHLIPSIKPIDVGYGTLKSDSEYIIDSDDIYFGLSIEYDKYEIRILPHSIDKGDDGILLLDVVEHGDAGSAIKVHGSNAKPLSDNFSCTIDSLTIIYGKGEQKRIKEFKNITFKKKQEEGDGTDGQDGN